MRSYLGEMNEQLRSRGVVLSCHVRLRVNGEAVAHRLKVKIYPIR